MVYLFCLTNFGWMHDEVAGGNNHKHSAIKDIDSLLALYLRLYFAIVPGLVCEKGIFPGPLYKE